VSTSTKGRRAPRASARASDRDFLELPNLLPRLRAVPFRVGSVVETVVEVREDRLVPAQDRFPVDEEWNRDVPDGAAHPLAVGRIGRNLVGDEFEPELGQALADPVRRRAPAPSAWYSSMSCAVPFPRVTTLGLVTISFARGVPAPECLPVEELADCARAVVERDGATVLNYGPVAGYGPLREWIAERHAVEPRQVLVTNGSLQGLSLLAGLLVDRGSRVLVEGPTYDRALHITARHEGEPCVVPTDADGLDPDGLELPAAFLYTIPTFQNPSGRTLSLERRQRLAELARDGRVLVVEDDPYALVRYEGERLPTIYELAEGEGVIYSFSFSKIVAPGLRVGYLVGPAELIGGLEALAVQTYLTPALLPQATAFEFVDRGRLEPNVERVAGLLRGRRDAMLATFEAELPEGSSWSRPQGGYFCWLDFPEGTDAAALLARAEEQDVTFVKGSDFFPPGQGGAASARLAFSFVSAADVRAGVSRLAGLLATPPRPRARTRSTA
jgi:2-aminoadipate transaminase